MKDLNSNQQIRIHQYHPHVSPGDAISNQMFFVQKALGTANIHGEIFAEHRHPHLKDKVELPNRKIWDADLLLVHHSFGNPTLAKILKYDIPKALVYHNITPAELLSYDVYLKRLAKLGRQQLISLRKNTLFTLADSNFNANELVALGYPKPKIFPLFDLKTLSQSTSQKKAGGKNKPTLLFVGRVCPHKNQAGLIRVFNHLLKSLPNAQLNIVGSADPAYHAYLKYLIFRLGLKKSVCLTGKVSEQELKRYYQSADAFVCLSKHEGFGIPLVEAMLHRIPVFASEIGGVRETMDGCPLLPLDSSPLQLAQTLCQRLRQTKVQIEAQEKRLKEISQIQNSDRVIQVCLEMIHSIRSGENTCKYIPKSSWTHTQNSSQTNKTKSQTSEA